MHGRFVERRRGFGIEDRSHFAYPRKAAA